MSIELSELSHYNPLELFSGRMEAMMATLKQLVKVPGASVCAWGGGGRGIVMATLKQLVKVPGASVCAWGGGGRGIVMATLRQLVKVPGASGLGGSGLVGNQEALHRAVAPPENCPPESIHLPWL